MKWKILDNNVRKTAARKEQKHERFSKYIPVKDDLCFSNDFGNLFQKLGTGHKPNDWHLFMNSFS